METINNIIQSLPGLVHLSGADHNQIENAEQVLNLRFATDYKTYLSKYGVISANGIELTGITSSARLSVVAVTQKIRLHDNLPLEFYVIEDLAIEKAVIVQNAKGEIFQFAPDTGLLLLCDGLVDYIKKSI